MRLAVAHHFGIVSLMRSIARGLRIAAGALCCTVLGVVSPAGATPKAGQSVPAVVGLEPALVNVHCIIFTSGYSAELIGTDFEREKKHAFLAKPYMPDRLAQTVAAHLQSPPSIMTPSAMPVRA